MSKEYKVRISETQRKLIMRALTTAVANRRSSGAALSDSTPDDQPEYCRYRQRCPHVQQARSHVGH
jgi:hypothetical protein